MSDSADLKQQLESERQKRIELEQQLKNLLNHLNEGSPPNAKNSGNYSIKNQNHDVTPPHAEPRLSVDEGDHLTALYSPIKDHRGSHSNSLENSNQGSDLTRSPSPRTEYTLLATPHSITQSPRSRDERESEAGMFIESMPYLGLSAGQRPRSYSATPSNGTSNSTNIPNTARTDSGGSNSRVDSMLNSPVISTMNSLQKSIMPGQSDQSTSTSTEGVELAFDLKQRRELQSLKMKLTRENEHFREHNRQLSTANQRLEHDNGSLKNRILSLERKLHQYEETLIKQQQRLTDNSTKITQLQQDKNEAKKLDRKYSLVCEEKVSLEVDLETWKRKYNRLNTDHQRLEIDLQQREYEVAKMTKDLQEKELTLSKMAMKLISLKQKIDSVESVLCKYFVKKLYKVFPSDDAQLSMTRNPSTQVVSLDILVNGKKVSHSLDSIQSVTIYPKSETRFSVTYKDGQMDVFESTARDEILRQLQDFRASVKTEQGTG
jgi:predicted  nucleic acid-binding Zn-ribbon protein